MAKVVTHTEVKLAEGTITRQAVVGPFVPFAVAHGQDRPIDTRGWEGVIIVYHPNPQSYTDTMLIMNDQFNRWAMRVLYDNAIYVRINPGSIAVSPHGDPEARVQGYYVLF